MSAREKRSREYCLSLDLDPDEIVWGYWQNNPEWISAPRWSWYAY